MRIPKASASIDTSVYDFDDEEEFGKNVAKSPSALRSPQAKLKGEYFFAM